MTGTGGDKAVEGTRIKRLCGGPRAAFVGGLALALGLCFVLLGAIGYGGLRVALPGAAIMFLGGAFVYRTEVEIDSQRRRIRVRNGWFVPRIRKEVPFDAVRTVCVTPADERSDSLPEEQVVYRLSLEVDGEAIALGVRSERSRAWKEAEEIGRVIGAPVAPVRK